MTFYRRRLIKLGPFFRKLYRITVTGAENIPQGGGLVCSNHTSMSDAIILAAALELEIKYMAKQELFRIPLLKKLIRAFGAYPVKRGTTDIGALKTAISLLSGGEYVGIFPQGTRCPRVDPETTAVKHGVGMLAYRSGCDVIPVYIKTKRNKTGLLRRTEVIVGKTIKSTELGFAHGASSEFAAASELIFARICGLR